MIVFFVVASIIAALALQRYFLNNSLKNLNYKSWPSKNMVEPGEKLEIISELHNDKWLPVLYVEVAVIIPAGAKLVGDTENVRENRKFLMLPRQKIQIRTPITISKRGRHWLEGATLYGGDFFGMETTLRRKKVWQEVVAIPPRVDSPNLDRLLGGFLGDISVRRFIMPDPVLTIGVREYTGREPQKDISWVHSVRARQLLVKQYDHTLELAVTVIMNVETEFVNNIEALEYCFSLARSVCEELEKRKIKYSFISNSVAVGAIGRGNDLRDGLGASHLNAVLECLGRGVYFWRDGFEGLLQKALHRAEQGRYHVIITPEPVKGAELAALNRLRVVSGTDAVVITPDNAYAKEAKTS